jgi:DNA (cytosine-5)-methyltransferase 1
MKIISLFSGCGGLDLGFRLAGFEVVFANDNDPCVWKTYEYNHEKAINRRSICDIKSNEIPDADGIIGGPPCQSWSLAGGMQGIKDERGQLFYEYIRIIKDKSPKFFIVENVPGIVSKTHISEFNKLLDCFSELGYKLSWRLLDARDYGVPQERSRIIIVGYRMSLGIFNFPKPTHTKDPSMSLFGSNLNKWTTLNEAIGDLPEAVPANEDNKPNENLIVPNHEYVLGGFSSRYMARNRRKEWNTQSFTIQASGRHATLHPNSAEMKKIGTDIWQFTGNVRRMSVRECARIQTFPDIFIFYYNSVSDGYKLVGNAVPVKLAEVIAEKIKTDLNDSNCGC